ncbi:hypothetical protein HNQ36_000022 [Afipia massiliensis]|uniref:Uncharacterized protein n=1 Tax=Afipia massiliensis TaxID=211460 RepID=A0A840MUG9_9BRAD|nr:hypothetical protein [Afipia massiliensis]
MSGRGGNINFDHVSGCNPHPCHGMMDPSPRTIHEPQIGVLTAAGKPGIDAVR